MADIDAYLTGGEDLDSKTSSRGPTGEADAYLTEETEDLSAWASNRGPVGERDAYVTEFSVKDYSSKWSLFGGVRGVSTSTCTVFGTLVSGTPFSLESIVQNGLACFRLTYTDTPKQFDISATNDALNPSNYTITGPVPNLVTSVVSVIHDSRSVDVYFSKAVVNGTWIIKVKNVEKVE